MKLDSFYERAIDITAKVVFATLMGAFAVYLASSKINNFRKPYTPPQPYGHELIAKPESRPNNLEKMVKEK